MTVTTPPRRPLIVLALAAVLALASVAGCGGGSGAAATGDGDGGATAAGAVPGEYAVIVIADGRPVASLTAADLADLSDHPGRRGPGPDLAAVLERAGVAEPGRTLVVEGHTGDRVELESDLVLEDPDSYTTFITRRATLKLESAEGIVRHIATITVV